MKSSINFLVIVRFMHLRCDSVRCPDHAQPYRSNSAKSGDRLQR